MDEALNLIKENWEILSIVATLLAGGAIAVKIKSSSQKIKSGSGSTNIQIGRDGNVHNNSADGDKD